MFVFVKNDNHVLVSSILFVLNEFQFLTLTNNIWPNSIHNVLNAPHHHNVIPTQPGNTQLINIICHSAVHHQTPLALLAPAPDGSPSVLVRPLGQHCEANNSRPLVKDRLTDASVSCPLMSSVGHCLHCCSGWLGFRWFALTFSNTDGVGVWWVGGGWGLLWGMGRGGTWIYIQFARMRTTWRHHFRSQRSLCQRVK